MKDIITALRQRGVLFSIVTGAAFLIYLRTLAPGVLPGDGGEFQFAAWGWTLAHPTGYPLYLLLGGIWQHLVPFGDPAYRLNLLSAIFAALTAGLTYRIFFRVARHRGAAFVAATTFAVSPTFWSQATETEVYALGMFFLALLTYFALKWESRRDFKYSALWALGLGLALTHHRIIILLIPGFAAFFAQSFYQRVASLRIARPSAAWLRRDGFYALMIVLPLFLYAYVPLRGAVTPYAQLRVSAAQTIVTFDNTPRSWLAEISGSTFQYELALNAASLRSLQELPQRLLREFNPFGVGLGLLGLFALLARRRFPLAALTLFGFGAVVLFNAAYHIGDISDYYTPAYFFFSLWMAAGLGAILKFLAEHAILRGSLIPTILLLSATAVLPLQNFFNAFSEQDRSLRAEWSDRWRTILHANLPFDAILISNDRDEITPMWYLQIVEGVRPDLLGLFPGITPEPAYANTTRLLDSVIDSGRPVFLIKKLPGLGLRYRLDPAPPDLYHVANPALTAPDFTSNAVVGERIKVRGYNLASGTVQPESTFTLLVFWQPLAQLDRNYTTSLQILDAAGQKVAQGDDHRPGGDTYPTSLWQPGEILQDQFTVTLPADLGAGIYQLAVKVYDPETDETLGDLTTIGRIEISN